MHILLVDDNAEFANVTAQLLSRTGHVVRSCASGPEARRLLREAPADLLITDILMPTEDGLELIMKVRQEHPGTAIIAITAASTNSRLYTKMAAKLGAAATLEKPFSVDELLIAIARIELGRNPSGLGI